MANPVGGSDSALMQLMMQMQQQVADLQRQLAAQNAIIEQHGITQPNIGEIRPEIAALQPKDVQKEDELSVSIDLRVDIHATDFEGNTKLHIAAKQGDCYRIDNLSKHLDIDAKNNQKQTPLHVAIESGQNQFVAALVQKGANINRPIPIGNDGYLTLNALGLAVMRGEKACIDELIESKKCNLRFSYQNLGSLLHVAIYFHQFDVLEYLLSHYKSQFDIESRNQDDLTPLSFAASLDEQEAIVLLHRHGASIDAKDFNDRLPIHHAAAGCHHDTIWLLASLGSKIDPEDHHHHRPLDIVRKMQGDLAKSCSNLLVNLSKSKEASKLSPTPHLLPPSNLVFRGGGPKGLAFVGALAVLQEENLLQTVERVAGTSAGAITAALIAINYPVDKLENLLKTTDLETLLLDHPLSKKTLTDAYKEATEGTSSVLETLFSILQTFLNPPKLVTAPLKTLYQCSGLCEGEVFREWLEALIKEQTGIPFLTFGELAQLIKNGKPYKHLHVYGTKVGKDPKIIHIHSNNSEWKDVIISDAVRLSMAIPGVFKPHFIHIKSNGMRIPAPQHGSFLDGGMLYNFPVETFDQKQFFTREDLREEAHCPKYNKRTLGLSLYSSLDKKPINPNNIANIGDLLLGICSIYMNAEESIRQLNPYNTSRVIEIDVKDVSTLSFNMTDAQKRELVDSGKQATKGFFENHHLVKSPKLIFSSLVATLPSIAFGAAQWNKYFGDVGVEPPLPPDINSILATPCPFWPNKTVRETHLLVLIPQSVNGQPLTLKYLGELVQKPLQGYPTKYSFFNVGLYIEPPTPPSHWVLMTRDVIEGSRNKSYLDQQALLASYSHKAEVPYAVPTILDAIASILMEYVRSGPRLYSGPKTYARCQEQWNWKTQIPIGGFSPKGLDIGYDIGGEDIYTDTVIEESAEDLGIGASRQLYMTDFQKGKLVNHEQQATEEFLENPHLIQSPQSTFSPPIIAPPVAILPSIAFGAAQWNKYFGDVGVEPPLPPDINSILATPCPFWPNKTVRETHLLVLIPQTVNDQPLTLQCLRELVQKPLQGNHMKCEFFDVGEYIDPVAPPSHWALMARDVIEWSRGKSYLDQQALLASYSHKAKVHYSVPPILDASVCISMEYVSSGIKPYDIGSSWIWIQCQEKYNNLNGLQLGFGISSFGDLSICSPPPGIETMAWVALGGQHLIKSSPAFPPPPVLTFDMVFESEQKKVQPCIVI